MKGGMLMNALFQRSMDEHLPLEMIYLSKNQQLSQREMIVKEMNGDTIRAYCLLRKQIRTFRIENILSVLPGSSPERRIH
jgi:predicted DNA-binding transcriptional regulator YafY